MTHISAEHALAFLHQLTGMVANYPESLDYRRGAVDLSERFALYLEALVDDPADDREVAEQPWCLGYPHEAGDCGMDPRECAMGAAA